jgi:hypothetical protein
MEAFAPEQRAEFVLAEPAGVEHDPELLGAGPPLLLVWRGRHGPDVTRFAQPPREERLAHPHFLRERVRTHGRRADQPLQHPALERWSVLCHPTTHLDPHGLLSVDRVSYCGHATTILTPGEFKRNG